MSPFTKRRGSSLRTGGKIDSRRGEEGAGERRSRSSGREQSSSRPERGLRSSGRSPFTSERGSYSGTRQAVSLGERSSYGDRPSRGSFGDRGRGSFAQRGGGSRFGGGSRGGRGGGGGGRKARFSGDNIDVNRFIQKAVVTEQVEHFVPEHKFGDFMIDEKIKRNLTERGYVIPTPIQDKAIPQVLLGNDVVGIANTGTGKTGAFLIPLLHKVMTNKNSCVIIMVPTRELAQQIESELKLITKALPVYSAVCVGGAYIGAQLKALKYKNEFIIGTPGRIVDLIERKAITLDLFDTIVLDEADRMLDMGFIADMKMIMAGMPKGKQSLLFSATISKEIERIINEFLFEPTRISVKTAETSKNIDQDIVRVGRGNKLDILSDLLRDPKFDKVLIFTKTKHGAQRLSDELRDLGFASDAIHGDKTQYLRQKALRLFKEHKNKILVATDVAARGLDISDVSHVINYDVPATYDDYVHRIGRTGRGGKTGKALTFVE